MERKTPLTLASGAIYDNKAIAGNVSAAAIAIAEQKNKVLFDM